jgi:hypothetical protein
VTVEAGPAGALAALARIEAELETLTTVDTSGLPGLVAMDFAARIGAISARLAGVRLGALTTVERTAVWALDRSRSMPWAIARNEDSAVGTIRAELTLAERLDEHLPLTAAALRDGNISLDKAKLLARLAPTSDARRRALPDPVLGEAFLLAKAKRLDTFSLTKVVTAWGYRVDPDADDRRYCDNAHTYFFELADTLDGGHVRGFLSPETTEVLRTALRAVIGVPATTDRRTTGQRQAEALGTVARYLLDSGDTGKGAKVRPHLNVSVRYETVLAGANAAGVEPATFTETGLPIPRVVLDRLSCDAEVTRIIFGPDGVVLDVGKTARIVSPEQRRGVIVRDRTCRGPTCHAPPRLCEVHHLIPWSRGGATSVENSGLLCWHCHDWIHAEHITVTHDTDLGLWVFTGEDGRVLATKRDDE